MRTSLFQGLEKVLGMNSRNRHLVSARNPKPLIAIANDKAAAKERLAAVGVPVPATLHAIHSHRDLNRVYDALVTAQTSFVVKPARSSRGRGVMLCAQALPDRVLNHEGKSVARKKFCFQLAQILDGEFSFGCSLDTVLIEQRLTPDESWIMPKAPGAPDLRIIMSEGQPIMAMARVPTLESGGAANLHRGAVGVGIDLTTGLTTAGVWKNRPVTRHPDTGESLHGHPVEGMEECLRAAVRCYEGVPLGYMGVDILFDAQFGPMVIEINARPGLSVQLANRQGLLPKCGFPSPSNAASKDYEPTVLEQNPQRTAPGAVAGWMPPTQQFTEPS